MTVFSATSVIAVTLLAWTATGCAADNLLSPCQLPDLDRPARCGFIEVAENRDRPDGRRLRIHVAVIPASSGRSQPDPIVVLMGGPGEEAVQVTRYFTKRFAPLLEQRDLLMVDQRGTGQSNGLRCDLHSNQPAAVVMRDLFPVDSVRECAQRLKSQADLTQYTYAHFARDLEEVRQRLGYGQLNLSAGSYGTRAAQAYLRAYPDSVRTAFFGSVVPVDVTTPLTMAQSLQRVLEQIFTLCADDDACHDAYPELRKEFETMLSRLDAGSVTVNVPGQAQPVPLHRGRIVERLRSLSYRREGVATVPWIIHQAYMGNWRPFADSLLADVGAHGFDSDFSFGLFFTITCNEDVAYIMDAAIKPATEGTFLGDYRVRQQQAACQQWPKVALPPDYRSPLRSSVPTLFVSGDTDPATPPWFTNRVAEGFPARFEVVMQGYGHTEWNDCVAGLYQRFVDTGTIAGLKQRVCEAPAPLAFKLTSAPASGSAPSLESTAALPARL